MARVKTDPPRGVLKTGISDPGRYFHRRYHPSPDLAPFIEHFWSVGWDLRDHPAERVANLPHPSVHLTLSPGSGGTVMGVKRGRFERVLEGQGWVLGVKFTPGGFHPFAGSPVSELTDREIPVRRILGRAADRLVRGVFALADDAARISLVEGFLRDRLPEPDDTVALVSRIVYSILDDRTVLRVEDLVARWGMPKRTLQRLFAKYVGVTPKWVIQRYRLHEAAEQLGQGGKSQSQLAAELGYSDQAHFIRDFRAVVGVSPGEYAASFISDFEAPGRG